MLTESTVSQKRSSAAQEKQLVDRTQNSFSQDVFNPEEQKDFVLKGQFNILGNNMDIDINLMSIELESRHG